MDETEQISELISEIYDAALEPDRWPGVLTMLFEFIGGQAASLYWKSAATENFTVGYSVNFDPHYVDLFRNKYVRLDPTAVGYFFSEVCIPLSTADFIPWDEFYETRFYREWAEPQRLADTLTLLLDRSATGAAFFVVFFGEKQGVVNDERRRLARILAPHIRRAVLIGQIIDVHKAKNDSLADTMDGIKAGMFLVSANGSIVHANAAGHRLLKRGDPVRVAGTKLAVMDPEAEQVLRNAFEFASKGDALTTQSIAVPLLDGDGERYVAHVLPMTSGKRRREGAPFSAVAAVFVHRAGSDLQPAPTVIAKAFGLTPAELRVLLGIVEIGGVPEVADAFDIAETTVRTHLGRIFEKTGTNRQADLVKLVASYSSSPIN